MEVEAPALGSSMDLQGQVEIQRLKEPESNVNVIPEPDSSDVSTDEPTEAGAVDVPVKAEEKKSVKLEGPLQLSLDNPTVPQPLPLLLVPSLRGKMTYDGGVVNCKGVWGMSDESHNQPGQTSDFEFKLVEKDSDSAIFPINGRYQGWFHLKQAPPLKGVQKVEDKEMTIKFGTLEDGKYSINGKGTNKFGSFTLKGHLTEGGDLHVYREYYNLTPTPTAGKRRPSISEDARAKRKAAVAVAKVSAEGNDSTGPVPSSSGVVEQLISPRESSGRVRKHSAAMRESIESTAKAPSPRSVPSSSGKEPNAKQAKLSSSTAPSSAPPIVRQSSSDRAQRLPNFVKKCKELLKEIARMPQGVFFEQPVDPIALNIPDYFRIVKKPMDFATIGTKLDRGEYESHDSFAEDMRLVFRNATTFNTAKDNPVNISARECSRKFEDRFRIVATHVSNLGYAEDVDISSKTSRTSVGTTGTGTKKGRASVGSGSGPPSFSKLKAGRSSSSGATPGPRSAAPSMMPFLGSGATAPLVTMDSTAAQIAELYKMMSAMQAELNALRAQVTQNEIVQKIQETKEAAHNPLTLKEKKELIHQIHTLPPHHMEVVLEIIKVEGDSDEVEVPLDSLDTFTLRKLQRFIQENTDQPRKKRAYQPRQSNGVEGGGAPVKKSRKSKGFSAEAGSGNNGGAGGGSMELFQDEEAHMLFPTESFDDLRAQAAASAATPSAGTVSAQPQTQEATEGYARPRAHSALDEEEFADLAHLPGTNTAVGEVDDNNSNDKNNESTANAWTTGDEE